MDLLSRIQDNPIVLLIPLISAIVGWFTNVVAIKMMFHPVEFVGIPPYLGWQGVIPANALRSRQSVELPHHREAACRCVNSSMKPSTQTRSPASSAPSSTTSPNR